MDTLLEILKAPTAPIPFSVVVVAVAAVVWGTFQWFYKERIKKIKSLFEMSQREVEIQSRIAERIQGEAKEKIESLEKQLDEIKSKNPPDNIRILIDRASVTTRDAVLKVDELGKANAAVSAAVAEISVHFGRYSNSPGDRRR